MKREYEEAFAEVDEILELMPIDLSIKIPLEFKKIISDNKAQDYVPNLKEPIEEQQLKHETKVILGLIYRDFIVSPEEREMLQAEDDEAIRKAEEELRQQYDMENIFQKRKKNKRLEKQEVSTDLMVYREPGFLQKLFNMIKGIFGKNKN